MNRSRRNPFRTGLAAGISALMLTLSVAVPVLERGELFAHPVAEAEHDPGECPSGHDHTVCTQVGANPAFEGRAIESPEALGGVSVVRRGDVDIPSVRTWDPGTRSRAPPLG